MQNKIHYGIIRTSLKYMNISFSILTDTNENQTSLKVKSELTLSTGCKNFEGGQVGMSHQSSALTVSGYIVDTRTRETYLLTVGHYLPSNCAIFDADFTFTGSIWPDQLPTDFNFFPIRKGNEDLSSVCDVGIFKTRIKLKESRSPSTTSVSTVPDVKFNCIFDNPAVDNVFYTNGGVQHKFSINGNYHRTFQRGIDIFHECLLVAMPNNPDIKRVLTAAPCQYSACSQESSGHIKCALSTIRRKFIEKSLTSIEVLSVETNLKDAITCQKRAKGLISTSISSY